MSSKPPVARVVGEHTAPVLALDMRAAEQMPDGSWRLPLTCSDLAWLASSVNERMARIVMPMG